MKVFNNDRDETVRFRIEPRIGDDGIYLELKENGNRATTVFPPSDAPALALAILEAAGVEARHHSAYENGTPEAMERIAQALTDEVGITEAATAKAKEQAELEAEALELYNARISFLGGEALTSFEKLNQDNKDMWLAVARKAREMRAEK